jgi:hypothetical protein
MDAKEPGAFVTREPRQRKSSRLQKEIKDHRLSYDANLETALDAIRISDIFYAELRLPKCYSRVSISLLKVDVIC